MIISELLTSMPSRSASTGDAKFLVALYVQDLNDLPISIIEQACKDFRRGNCGDGHWAPTVAEIRAQAIKYLPRQAPLNRLGYEDKPRDPAERERVKQGFANLLAELRGKLVNDQKVFDGTSSAQE